jgi:hypothetical protein
MMTLYDMLDMSTGGISEWILPLVISAHLSHVYWVRSAWSHQFDDGQYDFFVGAWLPDTENHKVTSYLDLPDHAELKVSLRHPYYIEDTSVAPEQELELKQKLCFIVTENLRDEYLQSYELEDPWCLSIDLDYFSCLNPFITDLQSIDTGFTSSLLAFVDESLLRRNSTNILNSDECKNYELQYSQFMTFMTKVFQTISFWSESIVNNICNTEQFNETLFESVDKGRIPSMYEDSNYGMTLWNNLVHDILHLSMFQSSSFRQKLASAVIRALPCLFIPHHPETFINPELELKLLKERVKFVADSIRNSMFKMRPPFMVTIARSSVDGFTPDHLVQPLQDAVLREIHELFCGYTTCRCSLVLDYGENEGSEIDVSQINL